MKNKPPYAIDSVDNALRLAQLLQHEGALRVTDAAERLSVSVSTAHRLLAMLVYRDFAERAPDRSYVPGPFLRPTQSSEAPLALLRKVATPHLRALTERMNESSNLMVRVGTEVRFLTTIETTQPLRVGDRAGQALPAHHASGGRALLAIAPPDEVDALYHDVPEVDLTRLRRELGLIREQNFALNDELTEVGVTAIGMVVRGASRQPVAAISLALPTARFSRDRMPTYISELNRTAALIEIDLTQASGGAESKA